jgi:hypothetical protein
MTSTLKFKKKNSRCRSDILQYTKSIVAFKTEREPGIFVISQINVIFGVCTKRKGSEGHKRGQRTALVKAVVAAGVQPQPGPTKSSKVLAAATEGKGVCILLSSVSYWL